MVLPCMGIARPHDDAALSFHRTHERRQVVEHFVGSETADKGQAARLVLGVELVDEPDQSVRRQGRSAFQPDGILDAPHVLDMGMVGLARAVPDPEHVAGGGVPVSRRRIDARHRLLEAEQQRFVARIEIGRPHLRMGFRIDADGPHEVETLSDPFRDLAVSGGLRRILHEAEHPAVRILQIGVAAGGESADQVEGGRRLTVGAELPVRIGSTGLGRERDVVDDVAPVAGQFHAVDRFRGGRAGLGELTRDTADLHDRRTARERENNRHLQEDPKEIPDVVGGMLRKALGAIAALEQESLAGGNLREGALQLSGLACKNERKAGELILDGSKGRRIRIVGHLLDGLLLQPSGVHRSLMTLSLVSPCPLVSRDNAARTGRIHEVRRKRRVWRITGL